MRMSMCTRVRVAHGHARSRGFQASALATPQTVCKPAYENTVYLCWRKTTSNSEKPAGQSQRREGGALKKRFYTRFYIMLNSFLLHSKQHYIEHERGMRQSRLARCTLLSDYSSWGSETQHRPDESDATYPPPRPESAHRNVPPVRSSAPAILSQVTSTRLLRHRTRHVHCIALT